ncbi:MAG: 2-oxoacid:acceptor oxidoreductase subunit alpha [Gammaproteobacteria bacterium]|nr:2-oxoacid:acceptor oxidoreductase subunit alpha [Gammaproteobacteria bacterium]
MTHKTCTHSIAVTGSGGTGAITAGNILLQTVAKSGLFGLLRRSVGPQIRGGESAALLRLSSDVVGCPDDRFDVLLAFDWNNNQRFSSEIPLDENSLVIFDPASGDLPDNIRSKNVKVLEVPLKALAKEVSGGRINMVGLGVVADLMGLSEKNAKLVITESLTKKGQDAVTAAVASFDSGFNCQKNIMLPCKMPQASNTNICWNISGNEAVGLGALHAGIKFVAAYPITPATDIVEWIAPRIEKVGGSIVQAEDELAAINMIIGASFGGVPSLTTTSGPGLSLMSEGIGLAVASEIPTVIVNVMRGGPSTGIPTKSEQSDLNIALYGLHGDAPHIVVAPLDIIDCIYTTSWVVELAETLQTPAIVLSDQYLGQSRQISTAIDLLKVTLQRAEPDLALDSYSRYQFSDDGVSAMAAPGIPGCSYTADGLEHEESGKPSSIDQDHIQQLEKRQKKLTQYDFGEQWAKINGSGNVAIVTWGSCAEAVLEAQQRLSHQGFNIKVIAMRLLLPAQVQAFNDSLNGVDKLLTVELSHSLQFYHYLKSHYQLPAKVHQLSRPGPLALTPSEVVIAVEKLVEKQA